MHNLEPMQAAPNHPSGVIQNVFDLASYGVQVRLAEALSQDGRGYAIHRHLNFSARRDLQSVFDDLALNLGCRAQRFDAVSLLLDSTGLLISASGTRKPEYCSCAVDIWAHDTERAEAARAAILARIGDKLIREPMISLDWQFLNGRGELRRAQLEELADDILLDEAYPDVGEGVASFIGRYLDADDTVLVLQGPPGTGKTRLIRGVLGEMAKRSDGHVRALYSTDKKALESDEIFVSFLTGRCDAFVVEDADHLLQPRAEGNDNLHRFLSISDGIARAQRRKIMFTTNLPNVGDLDDALVRPGRCFAVVQTRDLTPDEVRRLMQSPRWKMSATTCCARTPLVPDGDLRLSLADVYKVGRHQARPGHANR